MVANLGSAAAGDVWSSIATGVDHLHRVETGSIPQDIYAIRVDLTNPLISIHASSDTMGVERGVTTLTFANNSGSVAAINGDWGASSQSPPIGLAMSDGGIWNPHYSDPNIGGAWGFFGCTAFNECEAGALPPSAFGFETPNLAPYRFFNAVGGNGLMLVDDGVRQAGCYDSARHPRSGICVNAAQSELWMIAVDGRRTGASGMTCDEMRDLALDLGCWDALMLDGGGSTTLVGNGSVLNTPSDGSLRSRPNHLGVILAPGTDPQCQVGSGRWCTGDTISTCSGGRFLGAGDCAFFGATCEEDGDWAYCVHFSCPNGDGQGATCTSNTEIQYCNDGWLHDGDCGPFGLECGEDDSGAACMDGRCEGPNTSVCIDENSIGECVDGVYTESSCTVDSTCFASGESAWCQTNEPEDTGAPVDTGDVDDSAEPGDTNDTEDPTDTEDTEEPTDTNDELLDSEPDDNGGAQDETEPVVKEESKTGCSALPAFPFGGVGFFFGVWMILVRRRTVLK